MKLITKMDWHGEKIGRLIDKDADTAERDIAKIAYNEARKLVPVGEWERAAKSGQKWWMSRKPGTLKEAITLAPSKYKDGGWVVYVPGQGSATYYVRWVELGAPSRSDEQWRATGHKYPVPRQPFLRPALVKAKRSWKQIYKQQLKKHLA